MFIRHAELHAQQTHIAQTLQAGSIPEVLPSLPGWKVSSAYSAAGRGNEVGGDFLDVVSFDGERSLKMANGLDRSMSSLLAWP